MSAENSIAIVGLALRVPGADTPEAFWANLRAGRESISFFSDEELRAAHPLLNAGVAQQLTVQESVRSRQSFGGTAPDRVREAIVNAKQALNP